MEEWEKAYAESIGSQGDRDTMTLGNVARTAAQGLTFGFADEIEAGARSAFSDESYNDIVGGIRDDNDLFSRDHPIASIAAESAGALSTGIFGLGKLAIKKGGGWAANAIRGMAGGAAEGGIYGAGVSETDPNDTIADRAIQVAKSSAMGAAPGALLGGIGGVGIGAVKNRLANNKQAKELLNIKAAEGQYIPGNGPVPMRPDARVATKQLEDRGPIARAFGNDQKVITNKAGKESVKQGVDPRTVSIVRNSAPGDKAKMREMLDMKLENMRSGQKGGTPKRVIGDSILSRYKHLNKVKNNAGKQIDATVDRIPSVDASMAKMNMNRRLNDMGAQMDDAGSLTFPEGSNMFGQAGQKEIEKVLKQATAIGDSPKDLHNFKRWLDGIIYTRKGDKSTGPLNKNASDFLDGIRADINQALSDASPEYASLNKTYSEISEQFSELHRLGGKNFDPNGKYSDELLGNLSRRMISNAQSSGAIRDIGESLTELGNKYNGKFDDDLYNLVEWQVELDRIMGATPGNSFQSEVQQAAEAAAKGDAGGLIRQAGRKTWDSMRNVNEEAQIQSLYDLLSD